MRRSSSAILSLLGGLEGASGVPGLGFGERPRVLRNASRFCRLAYVYLAPGDVFVVAPERELVLEVLLSGRNPVDSALTLSVLLSRPVGNMAVWAVFIC